MEANQQLLTEQVSLAVMLGKFRVRISAGPPAILTEVFRTVSYSLRANSGIVQEILVKTGLIGEGRLSGLGDNPD